MGTDFESYVAGTCPLPDKHLVWPLYGVGLERLGRDGRPVEWKLPRPGPDELLARVDACGLCFSDIKVLKLGHRHPRIADRDLESNPVVLGHEVALTVVAVGSARAGQYQVGDRFVIQADIYYHGQGMAFGYALHGGLEQYAILGPPVLDGDDGCYLIPVDESIGYSEAALAEPWACVECAFRVEHRRQLKPGGVTLVFGAPGCRDGYRLGALANGPAPAAVMAINPPALLADDLRAACTAWGIDYVQRDAADLPTVVADVAPEGVHDLILLDPDADTAEVAGTLLAVDGHLCLMVDKPLQRKVEVDAGRIHYDNTRYIGAAGLDLAEAYSSTRSVKPVPGGKMLIAGAAGPMGQMHVQRALEVPGGPALVVATDLDSARLATLTARFGALAEARGRQLVCLNPGELGEDYERRLAELAPGGFDDIVMLVPAAPIISRTSAYLADGAMYNIFAGVAKGTMISVDLSDVALRGVRLTGTSGSAIEDLQTTIRMTREGSLAPNRAVAAIGGIQAAWEGLKAVQDGRFPGKVVIYPHLLDLPLTPLEELARTEPEVAAALDEAGAWTRAAEEVLLRKHVHGCGAGPKPGAGATGEAHCPRLPGKVALVTGAAQGLGEALAERLAREGCAVCVADLNEAGAREVAERIAQTTGATTMAVGMDVTDDASVAEGFARCVAQLGVPDVVVSNAGILISGATPEFEPAEWEKVIRVNLVGYYIVARRAIMALLQAGRGGSIIQINSKSGKRGSFRNSAYAASKFGGIGLTQSLALEFAEQGIRVNAVCPGNLLDSPLWVNSLYRQYAQRWGITEEEVRQKYIDQVPMKRGCTYEDVANVVVFLASDQSSYMTGQAINVTGGQIMH